MIMNSEMVDMNSEMVVMNKFGMDFMNKFELGDMSIEEFFSEDWDLINDVVNKDGWYKYMNSRGEVEIEYVGEVLKNIEELREYEKEFLGDGSDDCEIEIKEDIIDNEEICYVRVKS